MENELAHLDEKDLSLLSSFNGIEVVPAAAAGIPVTINVDISKVVTAIADAHTQTTITREEQRTERERIRRLSAVLIAQMQENTKRYEIKVKSVHEERMKLINQICDIASRHELSSEAVDLVRFLLNYLLQSGHSLTYQESKPLDIHL